MKSKMKFLVAVVFSVTVLAVTANAQGAMKPIADTGMLTLGPNQILRITVSAGLNGDDNTRVRFRQMEYIEQGHIYRVGSANTSTPISLASGEATSMDIPNMGPPVRGVVLSSNRNAKVVGIVFDTSTQRIVAICTFIPD